MQTVPTLLTPNLLNLQGVLVGASADNKELLLDDGTAVLPLRCVAGKKGKDGKESDPESVRLQELFAGRSPVGSYVLAVGKVHAAGGESRALRWRRLEDLSACPDREALWALEVVELWRDAPLPLKTQS